MGTSAHLMALLLWDRIQTKVGEIWFGNKMRPESVRSATKEEKKVRERS